MVHDLCQPVMINLVHIHVCVCVCVMCTVRVMMCTCVCVSFRMSVTLLFEQILNPTSGFSNTIIFLKAVQKLWVDFWL